MTIVLPIPADDAPPREWALYLAACAAHRGNSGLAGAWEQVAATFSQMVPAPAGRGNAIGEARADTATPPKPPTQ